jgi:hypothetical protein
VERFVQLRRSADLQRRRRVVPDRFTETATGLPAPVAGFGARWEDSLPGIFNGRIRVFNEAEAMIGSFDFSGLAQLDGPPGSAPFFGALSDQRNISYAYFDDLTGGGPFGEQGFALGTFYVQENPTPVPEPASLLLFGAGIAAAAAINKRREQRTQAA